jgi:hypothetical protein
MTKITVEFVNEPNRNPKFGSIKGKNGVYYSVGADVLHRYKSGMTFDAPVQSRDYKGKTYYSIPDSFDPGDAPSTPAPQPKPNGNGAGYVRDDDYICRQAMAKSMIEAGMFNGTNLDEIVGLAGELAIRLRHWVPMSIKPAAPAVAQPVTDPMAEEIPF